MKGLQQKREDASTEVANLSLKNRELCEELTHIDDLAKRLEMDKERVLETADTELQEARVGLTVSGGGGGQKHFTLMLCFQTERTSEAAEDDRGSGGHHHQDQKGLQNQFFLPSEKRSGVSHLTDAQLWWIPVIPGPV